MEHEKAFEGFNILCYLRICATTISYYMDSQRVIIGLIPNNPVVNIPAIKLEKNFQRKLILP